MSVKGSFIWLVHASSAASGLVVVPELLVPLQLCLTQGRLQAAECLPEVFLDNCDALRILSLHTHKHGTAMLECLLRVNDILDGQETPKAEADLVSQTLHVDARSS